MPKEIKFSSEKIKRFFSNSFKKYQINSLKDTFKRDMLWLPTGIYELPLGFANTAVSLSKILYGVILGILPPFVFLSFIALTIIPFFIPGGYLLLELVTSGIAAICLIWMMIETDNWSQLFDYYTDDVLEKLKEGVNSLFHANNDPFKPNENILTQGQGIKLIISGLAKIISSPFVYIRALFIRKPFLGTATIFENEKINSSLSNYVCSPYDPYLFKTIHRAEVKYNMPGTEGIFDKQNYSENDTRYNGNKLVTFIDRLKAAQQGSESQRQKLKP